MAGENTKKSWVEIAIEEIYLSFYGFFITYIHSLFQIRKVVSSNYETLIGNTEKKYINPFYYFCICLFTSIVIIRIIIYSNHNNLNIDALKSSSKYLADNSFLEKMIALFPSLVILTIVIYIFSLLVNKESSIQQTQCNTRNLFKNITYQIMGSVILTYTILRLLEYLKINIKYSSEFLFAFYFILLAIILIQILVSTNKLYQPQIENFWRSFCRIKGYVWAFLIGILLIYAPILSKNILQFTLKKTNQLEYVSTLSLLAENFDDTLSFTVSPENGRLHLTTSAYIKNEGDNKVIFRDNSPLIIYCSQTSDSISLSLTSIQETEMNSFSVQSKDIQKIKLAGTIDSAIYQGFFMEQSTSKENSHFRFKFNYYPENIVELNRKQSINIKLKPL